MSKNGGVTDIFNENSLVSEGLKGFFGLLLMRYRAGFFCLFSGASAVESADMVMEIVQAIHEHGKTYAPCDAARHGVALQALESKGLVTTTATQDKVTLTDPMIRKLYEYYGLTSPQEANLLTATDTPAAAPAPAP